MLEHERHAADHRVGVGDVATGDVGRRAVRGLAVRPLGADAGRRHEAERADQSAALIAQDVAEQILHHHHVELGRVETQVRGGRVDQHVQHVDVGEARSLLLHDLVPQHARLEDVALVDVVQHALALRRELEGEPHHAPDVLLVVAQRLRDEASPSLVRAPVLVAGVQAAEQLAHHDEIEAVADDPVSQRRDVGELGGQHDRPKVREGLEVPAQRHHAASLGLELDGDLRGLLVREPDGPFEHRVDLRAEVPRLLREGVPVLEVRRRAERSVLEPSAMGVLEMPGCAATLVWLGRTRPRFAITPDNSALCQPGV